MKNIKIYINGTCGGNPGPGGAAFLVIDEKGKILHRCAHGYHRTTQGRMEVTALIMALEYINGYGSDCPFDEPIRAINIFSDSNRVVKTMNGEWDVYSDKDLWVRAFQLIGSIKSTFPKMFIEFELCNYGGGHPLYRNVNKMAAIVSYKPTLADEECERQFFVQAVNAPIENPNPLTEEGIIAQVLSDVTSAARGGDSVKVRAALVKLYDFAYAKGWDNGQAEFIPE